MSPNLNPVVIIVALITKEVLPLTHFTCFSNFNKVIILNIYELSHPKTLFFNSDVKKVTACHLVPICATHLQSHDVFDCLIWRICRCTVGVQGLQ